MENTIHKSNLNTAMKRLSQKPVAKNDLTLINQQLTYLQRELIKAKTNLATAEEEYRKLSAIQASRVLAVARMQRSEIREDTDALELGYKSVVNALAIRDAAKEIAIDLERQIAELEVIISKDLTK